MSELKLSSSQFSRRLEKIQSKITTPLLVIIGKKSEVEELGSNSAIFIYLSNYEFPETLLLITKEKCFAVTTPKKKQILDSLKCDKLQIFERNKDGTTDSSIMKELQKITNDVLLCEKEKLSGLFCSRFLSIFNIHNFFAGKFFMEKEKEEIEIMRSGTLFLNYLLEETIKMVKNNKEDIPSQLETLLDTPTKNFNIKLSHLEHIYPPIVQKDRECVLVRIGIRYMSYCTEVQRILFYDEDDLEIYERRNENITNLLRDDFDKANLTSIGLLQDEGKLSQLNSDENIENGIFKFKTSHKGNVIVDIVERRNSDWNILTDDIKYDFRAKTFTNDFLILRQKTDFEKKRISRQKKLEKEIEINENQKNLMDKLNEEMISFYESKNTSHLDANSDQNSTQARLPPSLYKKESDLIRSNRIVIDKRTFNILIPIKHKMVPFHIEYIKNCSINEKNLRINFKENEIIKSITFKTNKKSLLNEINECKKEYYEKKEISNIKAQGSLNLRQKKFILNDVKIKTENKTLKKNAKNILELHENGFKFNNLEILFKNIKHVFYQQGNVFLLHFKLKDKIIFNNKKCEHVQFYKEIIENNSVDVSKYIPNDKERFEDEQEILRFKNIKNEFDNFIKNIENNSNLRIDRVSTEIYFEGVPFRSNVQIRPSSNCLVYLEDSPFLIIDFDEMEVVNFERVNFVSRSFDLTFIFKNKTFISVTSIDSKSMDYLREFIDSRNICFIQTAQNINWNNLLKSVLEEPISFYKDGGWSSLQPIRDDTNVSESEQSELSEPSSVSDESLSGTDDEESEVVSEEEDDSDVVDLNEIDSNEDYESSDSEKYKRKRR